MILSLITRFLPTFLPAIGPLLNPWVLLGFVLIVTGAAGTGFFYGNRAGLSKLYEYQGEQAVAKVAVIRKIETLKEIVRVPHVKREIQIETRFVYLDKEASHVPSRPACNVTAGWLRYHDSAADSSDGRVEGALDDPADTGVTEAQAARVVAGNYKAFHQVANDLTACRAFADGIGKITSD